jgi:hypothetical protein
MMSFVIPSEADESPDSPIALDTNMHWQRTLKHLIDTLLQRGDRQCHTPVTALAVFKQPKKNAEAVRIRVAVRNHLAEARC